MADLILFLHALWVLFMVGGILVTLGAFIKRSWFEWTLFRTVHLFGLLCTAAIGIFGWICPLTTLENALRSGSATGSRPESFLVYYLNKIVFWDFSRSELTIATTIAAVIVVMTYLLKPPARIRLLLAAKKQKKG